MSFRAFRIFIENDRTTSRFVDLVQDDLDQGNVVIRTAYSSVNYKDALAASGAAKVIRRSPCIGGIDVAGVVESSQDPRFKTGDEVLVTGYDMGVAHDGGYSEHVRVPGDWVVRLPRGMSLLESMVLGTAGFTAGLAIHRLEQNDLRPENGKVVVTGATGGVGSLAVAMLSHLGYHVVAMTRKASEQDYLKALGAKEILLASDVDLTSKRPLESAQWAAAFDSVGGDTLSWLTRTMQQNGVIASFGNAGGIELHTTVMPFILRGVRLIGIDSAATPMPLRQIIWRRLSTDLHTQKLGDLAHTVSFDQLPQVFEKMLRGATRGRTLVKIGA
jgi:putative YhdH/YhfP family quinone oxidoreductase